MLRSCRWRLNLYCPPITSSDPASKMPNAPRPLGENQPIPEIVLERTSLASARTTTPRPTTHERAATTRIISRDVPLGGDSFFSESRCLDAPICPQQTDFDAPQTRRRLALVSRRHRDPAPTP